MPGLDALAVGGLAPDGKGVTDARDARHAVGGLLAAQGPSALDVRTGVLTTPGSTALLTGTSKTGPKMSVLIRPHVLVGSRGGGNVPYRAPTLDIDTEVDVDLAPASGSRIDVVYGRQRDGQSGIPTPDPTTGPEWGVLKGTASTGTPTKPDLSTIPGAVELGTVTVAAGATSTNGANVIIAQTARQTVARGAPIPVRTQAERDALTRFPSLAVYRLDTGDVEIVDTTGAWATLYRQTRIAGKAWRTGGSSATLPANVNNRVALTASRTSGGVTFSSGTSTLTVPVAGLYKVTARAYALGGGAPWQVACSVQRTRSGVPDVVALLVAELFKHNAADEWASASDEVPLAAGDALWLSYNPTVGSVTQYYGAGEASGVALSVEYAGPLSGATPI